MRRFEALNWRFTAGAEEQREDSRGVLVLKLTVAKREGYGAIYTSTLHTYIHPHYMRSPCDACLGYFGAGSL